MQTACSVQRVPGCRQVCLCKKWFPFLTAFLPCKLSLCDNNQNCITIQTSFMHHCSLKKTCNSKTTLDMQVKLTHILCFGRWVHIESHVLEVLLLIQLLGIKSVLHQKDKLVISVGKRLKISSAPAFLLQFHLGKQHLYHTGRTSTAEAFT